jgi:hypothetical protein
MLIAIMLAALHWRALPAIGDVTEFDIADAWSDAVAGSFVTIDFTGLANGTLVTDQFA